MIIRKAKYLVRGMHLVHKGKKWTIHSIKEQSEGMITLYSQKGPKDVENIHLYPDDFVELWISED